METITSIVAFFAVGIFAVLIVFASLMVSNAAYNKIRDAQRSPEKPEDLWAETSEEAQMSEEEWSALLASDIPPEYLDEDDARR